MNVGFPETPSGEARCPKNTCFSSSRIAEQEPVFMGVPERQMRKVFLPGGFLRLIGLLV